MRDNKGRFVKGHNTWAKGQKFSKEHKEKLRLAKLGKCRAGNPEKWKHSQETKTKISLIQRGKKLSEEHKKKISWGNKGKTISEEQRKKISKTLNGHPAYYRPPIGEKHWFYNGGKKRLKITQRAWDAIRCSILERDDYSCKLCGELLDLKVRVDGLELPNLHIHHIDKDKSNNQLGNLVTLCISCHTKIHMDIDCSWNAKYAFGNPEKLDR